MELALLQKIRSLEWGFTLGLCQPFPRFLAIVSQTLQSVRRWLPLSFQQTGFLDNVQKTRFTSSVAELKVVREDYPLQWS